jgi:hypothetical protein
MRAFALGVVVLTVGCAATVHEPRGANTARFRGATSLVFTNASPARMCGLFIAADDGGKLGDNWLPRGGLASGASLEFRVKPGRYQATWATCRPDRGVPFFAATLTRETAFEVTEDAQLFAFVADTVAPTTRAPLRPYHKLITFAGQPIDPDPRRRLLARAVPKLDPNLKLADIVVAVFPRLERVAPPPPPSRTANLGAFIDRTAVRAAARTRSKQPVRKASLKRAHDVASARVGYVPR